MATLTIKTADELVALDLQDRWRSRRAGRETQVSKQVLRAFVDRGGPIPSMSSRQSGKRRRGSFSRHRLTTASSQRCSGASLAASERGSSWMTW